MKKALKVFSIYSLDPVYKLKQINKKIDNKKLSFKKILKIVSSLGLVLFSTTFLVVLNFDKLNFSNNKNLEQQLESYKTELNNKISSLKISYNDQIDQIKEFKKNHNLLKTISLKELEDKVSNLDDQNKKALKQIEHNDKLLKANQDKLNYLTNLKNQYSKQITTLEQNKNENLKQINQINLQTKSLETKIINLNQQIKQTNELLINKTNQNNQLKTQITTSSNQIIDNNALIRNTNQLISDIQAEKNQIIRAIRSISK
ncbi:hypothetical protein MmmBen326_0302 [Mycoplasma mycoides subsp. mycoides]|uniref:hypothetical protein n=1 Tax=Mycoplasma mycoides TaxID=2102 RepID=UPI0007684506|nr:hypothetical protein [Mycoplasma mycoides]AME13554.1 hypothetical protein MmmBen326_0302 [Mycoplasma mycoides subsp. mycoides]